MLFGKRDGKNVLCFFSEDDLNDRKRLEFFKTFYHNFYNFLSANMSIKVTAVYYDVLASHSGGKGRKAGVKGREEGEGEGEGSGGGGEGSGGKAREAVGRGGKWGEGEGRGGKGREAGKGEMGEGAY